jgi:ribosomal protein L35
MDKAEKQRVYRQKTNNSITKRYEKTKGGFLMRMYRNMKSRIAGIQTKKSHLYLGKELMSKEDFYSIAKNSTEFDLLFNNWELNNYSRKLTPSIDRIDPKLGYIKSNIRFVTHSENSKNTTRHTKTT